METRELINSIDGWIKKLETVSARLGNNTIITHDILAQKAVAKFYEIFTVAYPDMETDYEGDIRHQGDIIIWRRVELLCTNCFKNTVQVNNSIMCAIPSMAGGIQDTSKVMAIELFCGVSKAMTAHYPGKDRFFAGKIIKPNQSPTHFQFVWGVA